MRYRPTTGQILERHRDTIHGAGKTWCQCGALIFDSASRQPFVEGTGPWYPGRLPYEVAHIRHVAFELGGWA